MKRYLIVLGLMAAAFLGGWIPMYVRNRGLEQTVQETEDRLSQAKEEQRLALLEGQLGMVLVEVDRKNFGNALQLSSSFFDGLSETLPGVANEGMREELKKILGRRDQITTALSTLAPEAGDEVRELYEGLHQVLSP